MSSIDCLHKFIIVQFDFVLQMNSSVICKTFYMVINWIDPIKVYLNKIT